MRRVGGTGVRKVRRVRHPHVHDREPGLPRRVQDPPSRRNRLLDAGDVDSGAVEHPTGRAEVVLHVDDKHRRPRRIEPDRLGLRLDFDHRLDTTRRVRSGR
jgi:hypothetical protein